MSVEKTESGIEAISAEVMLLNWNVTATGGAKLVFAISEDELEPFRTLTRKEGKRPGQRLQAVFAIINEDEQPAKVPIGPRCMLAVRWCKEQSFQLFLGKTWPTWWAERCREQDGEYPSAETIAAYVVQKVCGVESRRELDSDKEAGRRFDLAIRGPYSEEHHG